MRATTAPVRFLSRLPNAITVVRFAMVPVFVVLYAQATHGHDWAAGILFGAAGVSDQIDGWLARRWQVESEFGKYADPLADRLMIDAAVIMLVVADRLPWPAVAVVVARDALLLAGTRFVLPRGYEFSVSFLGKAATWVLYAGVGFLLVTHPHTAWPKYVFWTGLGMAVGAGVLYVGSAWRAVRGSRHMGVTET
jgi:CDP-diacylglycerol--glycerol-3-phosphate 3-phosphatidyltransferase